MSFPIINGDIPLLCYMTRGYLFACFFSFEHQDPKNVAHLSDLKGAQALEPGQVQGQETPERNQLWSAMCLLFFFEKVCSFKGQARWLAGEVFQSQTTVKIWSVVWNMNFIFPYIGTLIIPNDIPILKRGRAQPPTISIDYP